MPRIPSYIGTDEVMDALDALSKGNRFISVWQFKNEPMYTNSGGSYDVMKEELELLLRAAESKGNATPLTIKFHPDPGDGYITSKSAVIGSVDVAACGYQPRRTVGEAVERLEPRPAYAGSGTINFEMFEVLKSVKDMPAAFKQDFDGIREHIAELEEELEGLREAPAPVVAVPEEDMIGKITGLINNPNVMNAIGALVGLLFPHLAQPAPAPGAIAGVKEDKAVVTPPANNLTDEEYNAEIDKALERLEPHVDLAKDLTLLADMAENNPVMFKMMLKMLREQ